MLDTRREQMGVKMWHSRVAASRERIDIARRKSETLAAGARPG